MKLIAILKRDKIDLIVWLLVIAATVQHFIAGINVTPGFTVLILYNFGVMYRLYTYNMTIRKQDKDILRLNLHIQDQNKLLEQIIKTNAPKGTKHSFKQKLEELYKEQRLNKNRDVPTQ